MAFVFDPKTALEMRKALQLFLATMDPETQTADIMEVATVFPSYKVGKAYKAKEVFSYGANGVGDPQLYRVLQAHTSSAEHTPETATSLYKKIGVTDEGYPEWVQPLGASDAYELGDIVSYNGQLWVCTQVDGGGKNAWVPGVFGWEIYAEG